MSDRLTWEERYKRDGDRWRYIYLLERELENRTIRRRYVFIAFGLNIALSGLLIWQYFSV